MARSVRARVYAAMLVGEGAGAVARDAICYGMRYVSLMFLLS